MRFEDEPRLYTQAGWLALYWLLEDADAGPCVECGRRGLAVIEEDDFGVVTAELSLCPWCLNDDGAFKISKATPVPYARARAGSDPPVCPPSLRCS